MYNIITGNWSEHGLGSVLLHNSSAVVTCNVITGNEVYGPCAGIYVLGFLKQRGLPTEDVRIIQQVHRDRSTGHVSQVDLEIHTPPDFPEKYHEALIRVAELCAVKKHLENPPDFNVTCVR